MGNQRVLLYFTLFFIIYMIWAQWQVTYGPQPEPVSDKGVVSQQTIENGVVPEAVSIPVTQSSATAVEKDAIVDSQRIQIITVNQKRKWF